MSNVVVKKKMTPEQAGQLYMQNLDLQTRIEYLCAEVDLLRQALVKYGDRSRMATVEPMELQQVIDRAFEKPERPQSAKEAADIIAATGA